MFMGLKFATLECNNNFLQLIKVIKQWKFYRNLCYKDIGYYKTINLHAKLISIIINWK